MQRPRTIVLGASGFIGGRLAAALRDEGDPVSGFGSGDCDLLDEAEVQKQFRGACQDANVVFCSAITRTAENSWSAMQRNLAMVHNFADVAFPQRPRCLVFLSSTDVYGLPAATSPISETTAPQPGDYYGLAKLASERLWEIAAGGNFPITHLRLPGVYGSGKRDRSVINGLRRRIERDETVRLTNQGETLRDYLHVEDLCRVIRRILDQPQTTLLNVASGRSLSLREICQQIGRQVGTQPRLEPLQRDETRDHDLVFDTSRLQAELGPLHFLSLEEGLRR